MRTKKSKPAVPYRGRVRGAEGGFTLVELLLVLVILALIGGLVLPGIIGKAEGAKVKAAASQINRLAMAVESYYLDTGDTPENLEQLVEDNSADGWNGPYVKPSSLKDPWGREYVYVYPGEHGDFDLYSLGADGQPGGEDKNADINSWE
ncbi:MAG: type II secretion system major pseudopilin GspG [Xanthomonadales bacterium]|nr:type II secretion system major pseudopilin GspG [Gammaproteobacteria bacterium]NNK31513.1 type II secretion system major pseudopilin GspG [Xanthomonadales bacterium]NNK37263.1 type II secretion system major pseudopilin GspG [Xanthomonadales bacterium]